MSAVDENFAGAGKMGYIFRRVLTKLIERSYIRALRSQGTHPIRYLEENGSTTREVTTEMDINRRNRLYTVQ